MNMTTPLAMKLRCLGQEGLGERITFHYHRLRLRFGGCSQLLDLPARLRHLFHRSFQRQDLLLDLAQTVRRFFQPARSRLGQT
jgi:hypothetical protein